jgi:hypothetical protein
MASRHSLRRVATLTKKVHDDLRRGGMGMTFRYLFRSTAILARVVAILADHMASEAEQRQREHMSGGEAGARRARVTEARSPNTSRAS